jgi:predicted HTH transcriptional regulator
MNIHNPKLLEYMKKEKVITTSEAAKFLKISWNTAEKILTELFIEEKVYRVKKEGVNLWLLQ